MYDLGNFLSTDLEENFQYTSSQIRQAGTFGANSRYYTQKYQGLFMMAAENVAANKFKVQSNYGSDGSGNSITRTFQYGGYTAYNLKIYNAIVPSVNQLMVFKT